MTASPYFYKRTFKLAAIGLAAVFAAGAAVFPPEVMSSRYAGPKPEATHTPRRRAARTRATPRQTAAAPAQSRYSQFDHGTAAHQKLNCASCHKFPSPNWNRVRQGEAAFPDVTEYPQHASCINCHRQQFFSGARPAICTICHVNPGPRNSVRHPFPNPREIFDESPKAKTAAPSDFEIFFPHDKHIEIVSRNSNSEPVIVNASWSGRKRRAAEESCAVCHKTVAPQGDSDDEFFVKPPADIGDAFWLKKGTFKSVPTGHTTCFTCHSVDSGLSPEPTDCATCHKPRQAAGAPDFDPVLATKIGLNRSMMELWRTRYSAGAFRHEFASHAELSCSTCHSVETMVTTDRATKKVPVSACNMCHITATADDGGVLNFEIEARAKDPKFSCVKCHLAFGSREIPQSHHDAVKAAGQ